MLRTFLAVSLIAAAQQAQADAPEVIEASAIRSGDNWTVSVSLSHPDSGWDHYANEWDVLGPDNTVLAVRTLSHPHVEEQPFTRSLYVGDIPASIDHVMIRVKCTLDGYSPNLYRVDLHR
jgi:hypothetical protein